ncbi:Flavin-containing monooxygenase FMO GS-OX-like 3 [Glycine soja]
MSRAVCELSSSSRSPITTHATLTFSIPMTHPLRVAVIGAGVAGLAAARSLRREGLDVVVFEKSNHLGGTWSYDPRTDSDPVGLDPNREVVHTSLYRSLRTNLPRQLMGFLDYPFPNRNNGDPRTFPGHEEVLWFLNRFSDEFGLRGLTRFGSEVVRVELVSEKSDSWVVESRRNRDSVLTREVFGAVVVCTGHFTQPRLPTIPGIEKWPGYQIHSHNYRVPEPFQGQIVVVIGFASSAFDISREIAKVAKEVHIATRSPDVKVMKLANHDNMWQHKMEVIFQMTELQCKWVARVLSGKVLLPTEKEMMAYVEEYYQQMEKDGFPKHMTHYLHFKEIGYCNWLAAKAGLPPIEHWRDAMYLESIKPVLLGLQDNYRDQWDDAHWKAIIKDASLPQNVN